MKKLSVALIMLMMSSAAQATSLVGYPNATSCGVWTNDHRERSARTDQAEAWLMGFLSGWAVTLASSPADVGVASRDPLANVGNATALIEWMNGYCGKHPLDSVIDGARRLMDEILRRQPSN